MTKKKQPIELPNEASIVQSCPPKPDFASQTPSREELWSVVKYIQYREVVAEVAQLEISLVLERAQAVGYDVETLREIVYQRRAGVTASLERFKKMSEYETAMGGIFNQ